MKSIAALTKQYEKEMELSQKHKDRAKTIADQIKYMQGEECTNKISRLNLTPEQYDKMLKMLGDKNGLLEALDLVVPGAEIEEVSIEPENTGEGEGDEPNEAIEVEQSAPGEQES